REANHQRMQAGHLVDDDHAGTLSPAVHRPRPPPVVELELLVRGERAFVVHGGSTSSPSGRPPFPPPRPPRPQPPPQPGPHRGATGAGYAQFPACCAPAPPARRRLHRAGAASSPGTDTFPR